MDMYLDMSVNKMLVTESMLPTGVSVGGGTPRGNGEALHWHPTWGPLEATRRMQPDRQEDVMVVLGG